MNGDYKFQMILDEKILIYKLEPIGTGSRFIPVLENSMYNFMGCSQILMSKNGQFAVSFKFHQNNLHLFERKYIHGFKVSVNKKDYEGTIATKVERNSGYILCNDLNIEMFSSDRERIQKVQICGRPSNEEIISVDISQDETRFAVGLGTLAQGADETITCIIVYDIVKSRHHLKTHRSILQLTELSRVVTNFDLSTSTRIEFDNKNIDRLIMFSDKYIFYYNYKEDKGFEENGGQYTSVENFYELKGLSS